MSKTCIHCNQPISPKPPKWLGRIIMLISAIAVLFAAAYAINELGWSKWLVLGLAFPAWVGAVLVISLPIAAILPSPKICQNCRQARKG